MDDHKISVTLTGAAKIDGVREPAGKTVTVSTTLALQLAASGVISPEAAKGLADALDMSGTPLETDFQEAVDAAVSARLVLLETEHQAEIAKLGADLADYRQTIDERSRQLADMTSRAETAEKKLVEAEAVLAEKAEPETNTNKTETDKPSKSTK